MIPVVTHYTYSGSGEEVDVKNVVPFSKYTDEMSAEHGIISKSGVTFNREVLQKIMNSTIDPGMILE